MAAVLEAVAAESSEGTPPLMFVTVAYDSATNRLA